LFCTKYGVKIANLSDTKSIFLPYDTDLTNIQNGSGEGSSHTPLIPEGFNKFTSFYLSSFSHDDLFNYFRGDNAGI
jgi:hypothetical protein